MKPWACASLAARTTSWRLARWPRLKAMFSAMGLGVRLEPMLFLVLLCRHLDHFDTAHGLVESGVQGAELLAHLGRDGVESLCVLPQGEGERDGEESWRQQESD